ncbi:MAG: ArsR/SmtB family transcription factor, partial [Planctomycetota bacterium]
KALSVGTRVKIIELLKTKGPLGASEIAATLGVTPSAVSQHLKILRHAGLVRNERKGYWIPHAVDVDAMERCRRVLEKVCNCGCMEGCRSSRGEEDDVAALRRRERELSKELRRIRARVKQLAGRKR